MKTVGVLGGTGAIGSRVVNLLKKEYNVKASYHTRARQAEANCTYHQVDVNDLEAVKAFCKDCEIVVNCAGASYLHGEKVARIANHLKIPYVDPSGEAFLEDKIADIEKKNVFVLSSGYFPGMSGLLMQHICGSFDIPEKIYGLSVSEEVPSQSAIEDFILTNLSGFGTGLSYYDNGQIKRDDKDLFEIIENKQYTFQHYLTVETKRLAKANHLKEAHWYNCSFGDQIVKKLQEAVIKLKNGDKQYKEIVKEVIDLFKMNIKDGPQFTYIKAEGQGILRNKRLSKRIEVMSECSSEISAIIAAYVVKTLMTKCVTPGIYYAMDIITPEMIFSDLAHLNMTLKMMDIEERGIQDEYEEGHI